MPDSDTDADSDSDSKSYGSLYNAEHVRTCTDLDSDPYFIFVCRTGMRVRVRTRVRRQQCKGAIGPEPPEIYNNGVMYP